MGGTRLSVQAGSWGTIPVIRIIRRIQIPCSKRTTLEKSPSLSNQRKAP